MKKNTAGGVAVAVVGATGLVGEALLAVLAEREFPVSKLFALASGKRKPNEDEDDATVLFADRPSLLLPLDDFDFSQCRIAFFCTPAPVSAVHVRRAVASGCLAIDVSSQFRLDADVPLIAADANADTLTSATMVIASPSAEAVQLASVLAPIQAAAGLKRVDVTNILAVSDRGRAGIGELAGQTARLLNAQGIDPKTFPAQIAFNSMAQKPESQLGQELRKILGNSALVVDSSGHYVPVFYGHTQVVRLETERPISVDAVRKLLRAAPGIELRVKDKCLTPVGEGAGGDQVLVAEIREMEGVANGLLLWTLADNIRKGAAVNSVQIAEALLKHHQ